MKKVKLLSIVMALVLGMSLMSGCSGKSSNEAENQPADTTGTQSPTEETTTSSETDEAKGPDTSEFVKLVMYTFEGGGNRGDEDLVMEEVNKILKEKINCELELIALPYDQYESTVQMAINSGEEFDICFTSNWTMPYSTNATKGAFVDITDMLPELAPGLWGSMQEGTWNAARINGRIYSVINQQLFARVSGFSINGKYYDEYDGASVKDIRTLADYTLRVKAGEEAKGNKMTNMCYETDWVGSAYMQAVGWERINPSNIPGTADINQAHPVIFNEYETDIYKEMVQIKAELQTAGVIDPDILTRTTFDRTKIVGEFGNIGLSNNEIVAKDYGWESGVVSTYGSSFLTTSNVIATMNAISATSKNPERALMFLELLNTNSDLYNLLAFGIEGTHYNLVDGNGYEPIEGSQFSGTNWALGCVFNGLRATNQQADTWDVQKQMNDTATVSSLMGFSYDGSKVQTELANCAAIVSEYLPLFNAGLYGDKTMEEYDKYLKLLKDAGIDVIIADIQAQVDTFVASK